MNKVYIERIERDSSKHLNGYSREKIKCEEFPICAEARNDFANFDRYCIGNEPCPYQILTSDENDFTILFKIAFKRNQK